MGLQFRVLHQLMKVGKNIYGESPSSSKELGKLLLNGSFNWDDWNEFYNYGFHCIQVYLNRGKLVKHEPGRLPPLQCIEGLKWKVLREDVEGIDETGEFEWIVNWLKTERVKQNVHRLDGITKDELYSQFFQDFKNHIIQNGGLQYKTTFFKMLVKVCDGLGYEINKHVTPKYQGNKKTTSSTSQRWLKWDPVKKERIERVVITEKHPNPLPEEGSNQSHSGLSNGHDPMIKVSGSLSESDLDEFTNQEDVTRSNLDDELKQLLK